MLLEMPFIDLHADAVVTCRSGCVELCPFATACRHVTDGDTHLAYIVIVLDSVAL